MTTKNIIRFLLLVWAIIFSTTIYAQDYYLINSGDTTNLVLRDSIPLRDSITQVMIADSSGNEIYRKIHRFANKRKWTKTLYNFLFEYEEPGAANKEIIEVEPIEQEYMPFEGKPIRNINIIGLSPFGTDVRNPDALNTNGLNRFLNSVHINTREFVIRNNLLFKKGDKVNPYTIAETETHLRDLRFSSDASIKINGVPDNDSVDVTVILRERFSIGFNIRNVSFTRYDFEIYDRNFLGLGTELDLRYMNNKHQDPPIGFGIGLIGNNFLNTFIRSEISFLRTFDEDSFKISAERAIHPSFKYLGGISYTRFKKLYPVELIMDTVSIRNEVFSTTIGRVFNFGGSTGQNHNLVLTGRFLWQNDLSDLMPDNQYKYLNYPFERKYLWLAAVTLFQQRYYRSSMIYNFGTTEDIVHGYNATMQFGYENHAYFNRAYGSASVAGGKFFNFGYWYTKASVGSYFRNGSAEQGLFRVYSSFFSPLYVWGRHYFRQFFSVDYTQGIKRLQSANELIYFSQFTDLNTSKYKYEASGTKRFIISSESDWFSPLRIVGFRLVPFTFMNFGWLGDNKGNLFHGRNFFSGIGLGIRTRNEQLVFKTIEFKLAWYPQLSQSKLYDFYRFTTSNPKVSPNFTPEYPNIIPFE